MKIAFISGSPKVKHSSSEEILKGLKGILGEKDCIRDFNFPNPGFNDKEINEIIESDVLVFSFPLYVDGIPSHFISILMALETAFKTVRSEEKTVYAIVNCGLYEGHQAHVALKMTENWCNRAGLRWGRGIGVGAGPMLASLGKVPMGKGPKTNLGKALKILAGDISSRSQGEPLFISNNMPKFLYKLAAEYSWRLEAKRNGLKLKELSKKHD